MTLDVISDVIYSLTVTVLIIWCVLAILRARLLPNTAARYIVNTAGILVSGLLALLDLARTVIHLLLGNFVDAGFTTAGILIALWVMKLYYNDKNWFNDQFKSLKKGMKRLGKRLRSVRLPSFMPAPNPA